MSSDFDFLIGNWRVFNSRLKTLFNDCTDWINFESIHHEHRLKSGNGNFATHHYVVDKTLYERSVIRSYNSKFDYWKIDRLDNMTKLMMSPLTGTFWRNKGAFLSRGFLETKEILVWVEWTKICDTFASWEQAMSEDNGKTWETNWVMEFYRTNR